MVLQPASGRRVSAMCSACGCPCHGNCSRLILMLKEANEVLQNASDASGQGEQTSINVLRRRCMAAEERVRRADREVGELKYEVDQLYERLSSKGNRRDITLIADGSDEAKAVEQICSAAVTDSRAAGAEAAARADSEATSAARTATGVNREAFRELCHAHDDAETGRELKTWTMSGWLESIGVTNTIADALLSRLRKQEGGDAPATERSFAQALGARGNRQIILALIREVPIADMLAEMIWRGAEVLNTETQAAHAPSTASRGAVPHSATSTSAPILIHKFHADGGGTALGMASSGSHAMLHGLDALLEKAGAAVESDVWAWASSSASRMGTGPAESKAELRLIDEVRREHCERLDSRYRFSSADYGVATTSEIEYWFVVAPEKGLSHIGLGAWPAEASGPDPAMIALMSSSQSHDKSFRRRPRPLREFDAKVKDVNARLAEAHSPPLRRDELIAARLLTSPMRAKYNATLRALASNTAEARATHADLCAPGGLADGTSPNCYPVTLLLINSALLKLSKLAKPAMVYRSVPGGVLPQHFWRPDHSGVLGGVEAGILSCVHEERIAQLHAARARGGLQCTLIAVHQADGECAADISWLSEYPAEEEVAFPPLTGLRVVRSRVNGPALMLEVCTSRASVCAKPPPVAPLPAAAPPPRAEAARVPDTRPLELPAVRNDGKGD